MAHNSWESLPSIIVVEILSYLCLTDKMNASRTCSRWRNCLFHPSLWRNLNFKFKYGSRQQARFFLDTCGKFVRNTVVEFNSRYFADVSESLRVLNTLEGNSNLEKLALRPLSFQVSWPGNEADRALATGEKTIELYLKAIKNLLRNSRHLHHLSVGCIPELTDHTQEFLHLLAEHQADSIESLHVASVKEDPDAYTVFYLPDEPFLLFRNLHTLSLDYDHLTNGLLNSFTDCSRPNKVALQKLIIHVHGVDPDHEKITNKTWEDLVKASPSVSLTLNLIHSIDGSANLLDILQPAMPLTHFRMFFCQDLNVAGINFIARSMFSRLESMHVVDGMENGEPLLYEIPEEEDPFVMLAWKCANLKHFTVIGYDMYSEDIVAIARLRGSQLRTLDIPNCCIADEEPHGFSHGASPELIADVSQSLGWEWKPIEDSQLVPAVRDPLADAETAYLSILHNDQSW